ncbi:MAG: hypothetical protein ILA19_00310 [Bacilli bacterium]|nr:hypothetical protein [Bacilli bacterium]
MYKVNNKKVKKGKITTKINIINLDGYVMHTKNKYFIIEGEKITDIKVIDKGLINSVVSEIVEKKFKKLIQEITELFINEDDSEGSMNEVLNRIEKFRQEIKNKYRAYLKEKELKLMGNQLKRLQKEARKKKEELINYQLENTFGRSR